jgi:NADP-dependent alcohol dehydrogenase
MIANFEYKNPVQIVFGENRIEDLAQYLPKKKILMVYGKGSIFKNGVYDRVMKALSSYEVIEFGGIEPNPFYETLMQAVELGRKEKAEFILAVGGGSVVDGAKFIAAAIPFEGDCWTILSDNATVQKTIPLGTVLTLPATGSEMNSGSVVSKKATREKLFFGTPLNYPVFSIMDVSTLQSLPKRQRANGVIDAFVHTTEQYMTFPVNAQLHDRFAESILKTLIEEGPRYVNDEFDKEVASNIMFSAMMALNGWISTGVPTDWSIHMVGHELTAMHGLDHGISLAVVLPSMYRKMLPEKIDKLAQYAERVWGLTEDSKEEKALKAIDLTEAFFNRLGVETKISSYASDKVLTKQFVADRFRDRGWNGLGEKAKVSPEVVEEVLEMAW